MQRRCGRWLRTVLACVVAALFLAGLAGAQASISFTDPVGDSGSSLDITGLEVSSDHGYLDFWATVRGRFQCSSDGDGVPVVIAIDTDQNPDTGSAFYGTEFELAPDSIGDGVLLHAHGWDFRGGPLPGGLGSGCGPGGGGYSVDGADLGLTPTSGFNVVVAAVSPHTDTAPDIRTFNYQQVPGTAPPTLGRDRRAPHLIVYSATAVHGKVARLRYWALDGRGRTAETIRVYRGARLLRTIHRPLGDSNPFDLSHVSWRVPAKLHGRLRFSVRSVDAAGNTSRLRWAQLVVR